MRKKRNIIGICIGAFFELCKSLDEKFSRKGEKSDFLPFQGRNKVKYWPTSAWIREIMRYFAALKINKV